MRLVVDANVLVGELLRARGLPLFQDTRLELAITERAEDEARHEISRRLSALTHLGRIDAAQRDRSLALLDRLLIVTVVPVPSVLYRRRERMARRRIPRDPDDWPTVALALTLGAAIWTQDADFLGCGVPTWTTETLVAHLEDEETSGG